MSPGRDPRPIRRRPDPIRPAPPAPQLPTDVAEALSAVLATATDAIRTNEPGSRDGGDIEHVHRMRVATRRIRAYLKAAGPALDRAASDPLRADLSGLARVLGEVRDLDVMIERLHREATALGDPDTSALERLIDLLQADREVARTKLIAELDRPEFDALLTELDAAAARPPVTDPGADLQRLAAKEWNRLAKARAKLESDFGDDPPDDDLHALRILGKRARYTAELLRPHGPRRRSAGAATPEPVKIYLTALAGFQEVLGTHQDACVLEDQLRTLTAATDDPDAALAAGRVIQGCRQRCAQALIDYPPAWDAVNAAAATAFD